MPVWMMVFGTPNNDVGVVGKYAPPIFDRIADAKKFEIVHTRRKTVSLFQNECGRRLRCWLAETGPGKSGEGYECYERYSHPFWVPATGIGCLSLRLLPDRFFDFFTFFFKFLC